MGVEPTRDGAGRPATVLKTGRATGPLPLPPPLYPTSRHSTTPALTIQHVADMRPYSVIPALAAGIST